MVTSKPYTGAMKGAMHKPQANNYDGGENKKGKEKWKNNKWKGSGEGSISSGNHNQNEETNKKSERNHKVGKKKFNKKGIQCYNCQK